MKIKNLLLKTWVTAMLSVIMSLTMFGQVTLQHSYKFGNDTVLDVVGGANGTIIGGEIVDTTYTASSNGHYIQLPAADIAINTYSAITLEAFITADVDNTGATMMAYFGGNENGVGGNGYFFTPDRWSESRTAISCGNLTQPWNAEQGITSDPVSVGGKHHIVSVLTNTEIRFYIDGILVGSAEVSGDNSIANLSNDLAMLCKGGYDGDPTWMGSIHEFNIYEGELDESSIGQRGGDFVYGEGAFNDASLASLTTKSGEVSPAFDPETDLYEITLPYGTTSLDIDATTTVNGATIEMFDGLGNPLTEDFVATFTGDGTDVEIIVTALDQSTESTYYLSIYLYEGTTSKTLSSIDLSVGELTTEFDSDSTDYTALLPYGTTSVDVTGVPTWDGATVTGDGTIALTDGKASAAINVTSEDGSASQTYNVDFHASKVTTGQDYYILSEVSGFTIGENDTSHVRLYHALLDENKQLFQLVENGNAGQYHLQNKDGNYLIINPEASSPLIMSGSLSTDLDSCSYVIDEFEPGRFTIQTLVGDSLYLGPANLDAESVINTDKVEGDTWAVWNIQPPEDVVDPYDTYLSDLTVDIGNLSPSFSMFDTTYHIVLPEGTTTLTVGATANDGTATVSGTGAIDVSSGRGSITVTVTATDPEYTKDYVINYVNNTPLTLMHAYTFGDGTAQDTVGDAHGTVIGGSIAQGIYTAASNGEYIDLPGDEIAINTYPTITLELYLKDLVETNNGENTMVSYFGNTVGDYGTDYYFTSTKSRAAISCENTGDPWSTESGVTGDNFRNDGVARHFVTTLTYDSLSYYLDGALVGTVQLSEDNKIYNLSNAYAYLCKSGYVGDLTWMGEIHEYNIYSGVMDETTIGDRASSFPVEDSTSNATLSDLAVDGTTIEGFSPYQLSYEMAIAVDAGVPTVTATTTNENASAAVTDVTDVPGTATVLVTAEDGETTNTYTIDFTIEGNDDATLSDITVDGTSIDGFDPETLTYEIALTDTTTVPTVVGTPNVEGATVVVNDPPSVPGTTTIDVTATDGETTLTYTIEFVYLLSSDASLSDISVDGTTINGFASGTTSYLVNLAAGTTVVPTVTVTTSDENASAVVTAATSLPGTTEIVVTAEDGSTTQTYSVNFQVLTDIETFGALSAKVYPTVSDDYFTIEITGQSGNLSVFDFTGKLILEQEMNANEQIISISNPGMYLIQVESKGMSKTFKVIKTR